MRRYESGRLLAPGLYVVIAIRQQSSCATHSEARMRRMNPPAKETRTAFRESVEELLSADSWDHLAKVLEKHPDLTSGDVVKELVDAANAAGGRGEHDRRVWYLLNTYLLAACAKGGVASGIASWTVDLKDEISRSTALATA